MAAAKKKAVKKKAAPKKLSKEAQAKVDAAKATRERRAAVKAELKKTFKNKSLEDLKDIQSQMAGLIKDKKGEQQYWNVLSVRDLVKAGTLDASMMPTGSQVTKAEEALGISKKK